ncbi:MAG TPA: hypothetical protein VH020_04120 [Stellaceae bacterium]|jgi:hypothetical protein|nr:hypothetical protein [Stellaceae bacterium]
MIRVSTLIWVILVALSGYAMFQVKAEVGRLDKQIAAANRQTADDREQIRTLNIEWAMLTQPQRLDALSQRVLQLAPIGTLILGSLDQPPLRDDLTPADAPETSAEPVAKRPAGAKPELAAFRIRTTP